MRRAAIFIAVAAGLTGCPDQHAVDTTLPLTRALLDFSVEAGRELELATSSRQGALTTLGELLAHARRKLSKKADKHSDGVVDDLNALLFGTQRFRREVKDHSPQLMLLPHVLDKRRGSCVGLAGLYLVIGEQLELPLRGVLVPGHFFVRFETSRQRRDLELLKRGRAMPRSWYERKYGLPEGNALYWRSLSWKESVAVFRYNLANEHRLRGGYKRAIAIYDQVVRQLPDFGEAHANLGLTHQLAGNAKAAKASYARALRANPKLGSRLSDNLKKLGEK